METRKVQEVGNGTFTISLPQDWARTEGISQGEEVDILTHIDGTLVVQTRDRESDPTGAVSVAIRDQGTEPIKQVLWAVYTSGYTEITLTAPEPFTDSQRATARDVVRTLAGVTITSDAERELSIQVLMDSEEISVTQVVRQLSFVALSMYQDGMAAVVDDEAAPRLGARDDQADRLYAITERSFARALSRLSEVDRLGLSRPELFELQSTARNLERVADHAERIGALARDIDGSPGTKHIPEFKELADQTRSVVDRAVTCVVDDGQMDAGYKALSLRTQARKQADELDRCLFEEPATDYRLARVLDSVLRVAEHGGNIAERGLQGAIRQENAAFPETNTRATDD